MTTRTKSALLLLGTLTIGMLLGAVISGVVIRHRMEQIASGRTPDGMVAIIERTLQPENETQRLKIRAIIEQNIPRGQFLIQRFSSDMRTHIDSFRTQLEPVLTPDQLKRFDRHFRLGGPIPPPPPGEQPGDRR